MKLWWPLFLAMKFTFLNEKKNNNKSDTRLLSFCKAISGWLFLDFLTYRLTRTSKNPKYLDKLLSDVFRKNIRRLSGQWKMSFNEHLDLFLHFEIMWHEHFSEYGMCTFDTVAKIHFSLSILLLSFLWFLRRFEIEPGFVKFCTLCRKLHYWDILDICICTKKEL